MQATYSNPKPTRMNSRKNGSVRELHQAFWSAPPLNYSDKPTPASLKTGLPPQSCVLLWMNCFLFHFASIFLQKLTLFYCSPEPNCCLVKHWGLAIPQLVIKGQYYLQGDAGVALPKNSKKDDPPLMDTISSVHKVVTSQCPFHENGPLV